MEMDFGAINWLAILACVVAGQVLLTVWFVAVFAKPWAKEYGVDDPKQHTAEVPGYTYAIGAACVFLVSLGIALMQARLGIQGVGAGVTFGFFVAIHFAAATALPGYAFLRRYRAFGLALGSQVALILVVSTILAVWR